MVRKRIYILICVMLVISGVSIMAPASDATESISITFENDGSRISGFMFPARTSVPTPTVILLHGIPGGEGDLLGLSQRFNEAGINAFSFSYRGTWRSEGTYLPSTSLEDVGSAIRFLKTPEVAERFAIDTSQLSIVGYSYGGGMALLGSLLDHDVSTVVSLAGGDLKVVADNVERSQEYREMHRQFLDACMADSAVMRGMGGAASHEWLLEHRDDFDIVSHAPELSSKRVLLIGGWLDNAIPVEEHVLPLYRALQGFSKESSEISVYNCGHTFEDVRDRLADDVIAWIKPATAVGGIQAERNRGSSMGYIRLYCDAEGESHFEDIEIGFQSVDYAPPAPPLDIFSLGPSEQCSILRAKPGWVGDWHPAPFRQLHVYLSGEVVAEASDGEIRRVGPGGMVLVEDTVGKGHRSRVIGSVDVVIAVVKLPD